MRSLSSGNIVIIYIAVGAVAETWRRVWGDGKFFRGPRCRILAAKISDDLFLVIDQVCRIFTDFLDFTLLDVVHVQLYMTLHTCT